MVDLPGHGETGSPADPARYAMERVVEDLVARQVAAGNPIGYQLDGTAGIDAGRLGTPTFGPMLLIRGDLRVIR